MDIQDEVAIVGVGCRFPGADNLDEFWNVLVNGENHVIEIPRERWNNDAYFSDNKDEDGKHYVKRAGFIKNYDEWDHHLFGVSENEATRIDPQQRYVLECTHMAMEDGGITRTDLKGSQTGVYIGVMNDDYKVLASADHNNDTNYSATGMSTTIIASRVSYTYDLQGPCMVIDTACSSAMVAIHIGTQALKAGDCEQAICGGVSSIITPDTFITLCKARMMSTVGQCQTFCDTADGYARGEGCGVVILKTVQKALKDGNRIWAILYTGSNQDGHASSPITAPSGDQQEMLLHKTYSKAGVDPLHLQYIEVHGTGTPLGDPTETNAIGRFITSYRNGCYEFVEKKFDHLQTNDSKDGSTKAYDKNHDHNAPDKLDGPDEYFKNTKEFDSNNEIENDNQYSNSKLSKATNCFEEGMSSNDIDDHILMPTEFDEVLKASMRERKMNSTTEHGESLTAETSVNHFDGNRNVTYTNKKQKLIKIGSVKTNIGHTESAAGVAGLIKVLLMMENGKYVPSLHLKKDKSNLNKNIKLDEYNLDVAQNVEDWKPNDDGDRICCVNSFGFGGSNSHAIVIQKASLLANNTKRSKDEVDYPYTVVCMSAMDKVALKNTMSLFANNLETTEVSIRDVAYMSAFRRDHYTVRTILYGKSVEELQNQVHFKIQNIEQIKMPVATRTIFVFCGVGTTWKGMCSELMHTQPIFRAKINEMDGYLEPLTGWCMADKLQTNTDYSDPFLNHIAIFFAQVALVALWDYFGITPDVIVGQSVGEVAASVASGSISLKDGVSVIYYRSKIIAEITGGKMMVVGNVQVEKIQDVCNKYDNRVTIAVYNSSTACTLSGDAEVMEQIKDDLEKRNVNEDAGILLRPLPVKCAYHSHHVEPCIVTIMEQLKNITNENRTIKHISTVTGEFATENEFQTAKYWADNIRQPVQFMQSILRASKKDVTNIFLEIGPKPVLRAHISNIMGDNLNGECLSSMSANKENISIYDTLNDLYGMGMSINWSNIVPSSGSFLNIPKYSFNKSKILFVPDTSQQLLKGVEMSANTHMYVRHNGGDLAEFKIEIDKSTTPFVFDHLYSGVTLVPGATYVEAAFEVCQRKSRYAVNQVSVSVEFVNPFTPLDDKKYVAQIKVDADEDNDCHRYRIFKDGRTLSKGTICCRTGPERSHIDIEAIRERCKTHNSKEESYSYLEKIDFVYGESLSLIKQSWSSASECLVQLEIPDSVKAQTKFTHMHPAIIDAMFQTFGILSSAGTTGGATLPIGAGSVTLSRPPQECMFCYSKITKSTAVGNHYNSLLLSPEGYVIAEIQDFYTKTIRITDVPNQSIVYDLAWNEHNIIRNETGQVDENNKMISHGNVVVFGSNRFIKFMSMKSNSNTVFYELGESFSDNMAMFKLALDNIPNTRAVVFAACHHVQQSYKLEQAVYDHSKNTFMSLALLIKVLTERNYNIPIFVITENVIACPVLNIVASNVCGGELWGMVRSAIGETAYSDIRLVDISLTEENAHAFEYLTRSDTPNKNEYLIDKGKIFVSEIIEAPDQDHEPNQREIEIVDTDELLLKSVHPLKVINPYYQLCRHQMCSHNSRTSSLVRIRIKWISLHSATIYPTSTANFDTHTIIWPETGDNGFQAVALEGEGFIYKTNRKWEFRKPMEKNTCVGFCFPINVASSVSIPSKCLFDIESLPVYVSGLMTIGVLLWNIAESCKKSSNIYIIVDDESRYYCKLILNILSKFKKQKITIESKDKIGKWQTKARSNAQTAIVLTNIAQVQVDMLLISCRNLQKIVSIDIYFPRAMQRWIVHNTKTTEVQIHNTENMFTQKELSEKVPKVHCWLKSLDDTVCQELNASAWNSDCEDNDISDPFNLPYATLLLDENRFGRETIPLKVFKTEVFRKNACYILVGGLTGLGWELLQVMAELGAGYLVTFSRRPPAEEKLKEIDRIQNKFGCTIACVQVDITDLIYLKKAMDQLHTVIGEVAIKGVFHGGGVVCDMLLSNMSEGDAMKPLRPKILGTWNLHIVTKDMSLDFFVMHSSVVSLLGNSGQCNYAAGNSFQDSFAHYRRSLGLCGQSINWSTLSLGMATKNNKLEINFKSQGFYYLNLDDIRSCFIRAVMTDPPQVTFGIFDWSRLEYHPIVKMYPYKFARLLEKYGTSNQSFKTRDSKYHFDIEEFNKLGGEGQKDMIFEVIKAMVIDTFVVDKKGLDEESRFVTLGIDSMAAMSFTNSFFETTQVRIPVVTLLSEGTTIGSLINYIIDTLNNGTSKQTGTKYESTTFLKIFEGSITFMQRSLLKDCVKNPLSRNFLRQADYEVKGLNLKPKDWKVVLNHLLKMNPELRRIYKINTEDTMFESILLSPEEVDIDMEVVAFDSICHENATDDRDKNIFDLTKDLPIKFKIACKKDKSRMRMYIHSVISDLSGVAMLFKDIGSYMKPYIFNKPLPEKETNIVPAECVRTALSPKMADLKLYWKLQLAQDIQPFTFSNDIEKELKEKYWFQVRQDIPQYLASEILTYVQKRGNSLYNFVMSVYMVFLYTKTGKGLIPIMTNVDMRGHVPQLKSFVTRCINAIPVIGDLRNMGTVGEYMEKSSTSLLHMTQQSGYPYELIEEEMQTDYLRRYIGRHRLVMDNMANINQTFKHNHVTVKLMNVFHTRHVYETTLYVLYDLIEKKIAFDYGYNSEAVNDADAVDVPLKLIELMKAFVENEALRVDDILAGNVVMSKAYPDNYSDRKMTMEQRELNEVQCIDAKSSKKKEITKRLPVDSLSKKLCSLKKSKLHAGPKEGQFVFLRKDFFQKQTTNGWDHTVFVAMVKNTSISGGELLLQWGKNSKSAHKRVSLNTVTEVHVKRMHGAYGLLLKLSNNWIVLKTKSQPKAVEWLMAFKSEVGLVFDRMTETSVRL